MTIEWMNFLRVLVVSLVAASLLVTLFSVALRVIDGEQRWRRPTAVALFALCGLAVAFGIYLIVPILH